MNFNIIQGDNRDTLKTIADNSIDAIITDPPYGIDFLGKSWDANTGALETYQECLRVLKPGGHILAFSAARTYHHLAVTLEQAGFEIRDQIMWIYSSGFPKSQDVGRQLHKKANGKPDKQRFDPSIMIKVSGDQYQHPDNGNIYRALPDINGDRLAVSHEGDKYGTVYEQVIEVDSEWSGWGTCLKPAHEPIALARKPIKLSIAKNCELWGTGAINIDATRVKREGEEDRFPCNVIGEIPDYQKYFYCPKVSRRERHTGFEAPPDPLANYSQGDVKNHPLWDPSIGTNVQRLKHKIMEHNKDLGKKHDPLAHIPAPFGDVKGAYVNGERMAKVADDTGYAAVGNNHPTVKPVALMRYLIQLVTPPNSTVLDPFCGSGSTGMAAVELGHKFVGCELDPNYVSIAETRIRAWNTPEPTNTTYENLFEEQ